MFQTTTSYTRLDEANLRAVFQNKPIVCKLTDFGESRSEEIQTATLCTGTVNETVNVYRGSPAYMAPDLKYVDIWALGMVYFMILNPDLDYPYFLDIQQAKRHGARGKEAIQTKMSNKELPLHSKKYHMCQASEWYIVLEALERCLTFNANHRPEAREICELLGRHDFSLPCRDIFLLRSQSTALAEFYDKGVLQGNHQEINIENDATNSCALLSVLVADAIVKAGDDLPVAMDEWKELADKVYIYTQLH